MRTLHFLTQDWRDQAQLLSARGPSRATRTRWSLSITGLLAMLWALLVVTNAPLSAQRYASLAFGVSLVVLATLFSYTAARNWQHTRNRTLSGLGALLLLLLGIELMCVGAALAQPVWAVVGALIGGLNVNITLTKLEASLVRVRQARLLAGRPSIRNR